MSERQSGFILGDGAGADKHSPTRRKRIQATVPYLCTFDPGIEPAKH